MSQKCFSEASLKEENLSTHTEGEVFDQNHPHYCASKQIIQLDEKAFIDHVCSKDLSCKKTLKRLLKTHRVKSSFACELCNKKLSSKLL